MVSQTLLQNLHLASNWIQDGNAGDTGGPSNKTNGVFSIQVGTARKPTIFSAAGAYPYNNGYCYLELGDQPDMTYFEDEREWIFQSPQDAAASQSVEQEVQKKHGGYLYSMALALDFLGDKQLNSFLMRTEGGDWIPTGIGLDPKGYCYQPTNIKGCFLLDHANKTTTHVGVFINGQWFPLNITRPAVLDPRLSPDKLTVGFQIDSNGLTPPTPYKLAVNKHNLLMMSSRG